MSEIVLITSLTKDSLVLAKILDTLKPTKIFLIDTETYSKINELDKKANKTIKLYLSTMDKTKSKGVISLKDENDNPNVLFLKIKKYLTSIQIKESDLIYFDITGGKSLTASIMTVINTRISQIFKCHTFITYCDYSTNSIISFNQNDEKMSCSSTKIQLDFAVKNLENRIYINNITFLKDSTHFISYEKSSNKCELLKNNRLKFLSEQMNKAEFRKIFNSFNELITDWIISNIVPTKIPDFHFDTVVSKLTEESIKKEIKDNFSIELHNRIYDILLSNLKKAMDFDYFNVSLLLDFFKKNEFNKAYELIDKNCKTQIANLLYENKVHQEITKCLKHSNSIIKSFRARLLEEINLLSLSVIQELVTPNPPMIYAEQMLSDYCKNILNDEVLFQQLYFNNEFQKMSLLFEDIVNYKITEIILNNQELLDKVNGIYANVTLGKDENTSLIEFDTLIMLNDGNFLNYEVKQHFSSATVKDLDARVENLKELLGPKNKFKIIYPVTESELQNEDLLNVQRWNKRLSDFELMKKPYKVLYFDKIEESLIKDILKYRKL